MTAEIAIMNKQAVSLAADSAITITHGQEQKILTSGNKLFALLKSKPVGVMVYGQAAFMDVPWETAIKEYRRRRGSVDYDALEEYADDLIGFLDSERALSPSSQQEAFFSAAVRGYLLLLKDEIQNKAAQRFKDRNEVTDSDAKRVATEVIGKHWKRLEAHKSLSRLGTDYAQSVVRQYGQLIDSVVQQVFEKLPVSQLSRRRLRQICGFLLDRDVFPQNTSGVVIAGFGTQDVFPALKSFVVYAVANDKLKYKEDTCHRIGYEDSAAIIAFAQQEMVRTFMEGVDPKLRAFFDTYIGYTFSGLPDVIAASIDGLNQPAKESLKQKLAEAGRSVLSQYRSEINRYQQEQHVAPLLRVVANLPKDQLAEMAESLVNLTSLKRRFTMETETVGGPIDVAVISKGDGFIWIRRKHYFRPELNVDFLARSLRGQQNGCG